MEIRVYIADDHTVVRDGLRALFEDFPEIQVVGDAASGPKAVSEVKEIQPDVVLMDIRPCSNDRGSLTRARGDYS